MNFNMVNSEEGMGYATAEFREILSKLISISHKWHLVSVRRISEYSEDTSAQTLFAEDFTIFVRMRQRRLAEDNIRKCCDSLLPVSASVPSKISRRFSMYR